jgi:cytochrome b561
MYKSLAESLVVIFLAALGIADALRLSSIVRAGGTFHDVIGPDRYLGTISVGLLFCGVWTLVKNLKGVRQPPIKKEEGEGSQVTLVVLVALVLVVYTFVIPILGYLLATSFFFPVIYFIFGVRPWLKSIIVGLSTTAVFYAIFAYFAEMPLPKGLLENIL